MPGFTNEGLVIPRQPEIVGDLVALEKINIDPLVNTNPDLFLGQFNNVIANAQRLCYEYLEKANNQRRLSSAEGRALDELGILKGVSRLLASPSYVDVLLEGINDIFVPAFTLIEDKVTKQRYLTQASKRILNLGCCEAKMTITTSAASTAFTITIGSTVFTRSTPGSGVNMTTTLGLLAGDINTAAIGITASSDASTITLVSPTFTEFSVTTNSSFSFTTVKSKVNAASLITGSATAATPGEWRILSPIPGWNKVSPIMASLVTGRDIEEDSAFRLRIRFTEGGGKGTTRAVRQALENVAGVNYVSVEENITNLFATGIPPYAIYCIVDGGSNSDIAKAIWETKGCNTHMKGSVVVNYTDEKGIIRTIFFDRPTEVEIDVKITYTDNTEELYPEDWQDTVKDSVAAYINALGLGANVIPSRLYVPIYTSVSGLIVTLIELKEHSSPTWGTNLIGISSAQFARTVAANISLVEV
jgi:uncharacterized phage protein gp47/JayE